jgi:hypothetical protein
MKKNMLKSLLCASAMLALSPLSPLTNVAHADDVSCPEQTIIEWRSPGDVELDFNLPAGEYGETVTIEAVAYSPTTPVYLTESRTFTCFGGRWG